jgi:GntR family transcriptional repressor for pyruvate dehydrogenase complex
LAAHDAFPAGPAQKISKEGVAEKVVRRILDLVKSGNLKAGDRLPPERHLVEILGVSRPTLREALRSLSTLGVVDLRHGGGAFVSDLTAGTLLGPLAFYISLSPENVEESFECRRLVEIEIARKSALLAGPKDIKDLETMLAAQANIRGDPIGFRILDIEFHEKLYELAGNAIMERMARGFYNLCLEERRRATADVRVTQQSLIDHREIVAGLRLRSGELAAAAMTRHLDNIERTTLAAMRDPAAREGR